MPNQFLSPVGDLEDYFVTDYWIIDQYIGDKLWIWGSSLQGKLGDNSSTIDKSNPVTTFAGGNNWKEVSCGSDHTVAIKTDGSLWVWGGNSSGQLGTNDTTNRLTPVTTFAGGSDWRRVSCGSLHTAAIKIDGSLWIWGNADQGRIGVFNTLTKLTPVTTFAGGKDWQQVSCGYDHTAAIKTDGSLWVWGESTPGKLGAGISPGLDALTPVTTFAGGNDWQQVSCGYEHTAAIKTDGSLWVWGESLNGALGNNTTTPNIYTPVTTFAGGNNWKQVSCGYYHTLAIKTDGSLWSWGEADAGELGNNITVGQRITPITTFAGGNDWKQISGGYSYSAAVKTDGSLWTWGNASFGVLGNNSTSERLTPVTTSFSGGNNWKQVSCGKKGHMSAVQSGISQIVSL
jgi:alpha-tubulin suppressor-like RCC1 family protein